MIPDQAIRQLQEQLDIVEVIGGYLSLKKSGQNFKGLCPFHPEKTPSFMIYPQKQFYICYGCGAGGDLISFIMRHEQLPFNEALELLAEKAGVELPKQKGQTQKASPDLYRAHEVAQRFYSDALLHSAQGEEARNYLKKRGLSETTWHTFGLGYAPRQWDALVAKAQSEGLTPSLLEKAGLALSREGKDGWYDRFRNRVIFPTWDARGRIIAFGGRSLDEEEGPKYMNSPETPLYVKGRVLYGLHLAAPAVREKDFCIVVEGYMDMISPYQHGIHNIVASMGTSLTESQVKLIHRMTRHVVMVYDGDYAGETATVRGLDLFLEAEMRVKVAVLPSGMDPDSLIKTQGVKALAAAIQESQDLFDFKLGLLKRQFDPRQTQGRVSICAEMLPTIKRVPNAIQRGEYMKRLGQILQVDESLLWAEMNRVKSEKNSSTESKVAGAVNVIPSLTAENLLAALLLENPLRVTYVEEHLNGEALQDSAVREFIQLLLEKNKQGTVPSDHRLLIHELRDRSSEWEGRCARWLAWAQTIEDKEGILEEIVQKIQKNRTRASLEDLKTSLRQAEQDGNEAEAAQLIVEFNRLMKGTGTESYEKQPHGN